MTTFADLGLREEVLLTLQAVGYTEPTEVQEGAIPELLAGRDVIAQAHTGTGKTAAFALPMLSTLDQTAKGVQGLVVVPTRELATQVTRAFNKYGKNLGVHALAVYGGQSYAWQAKKLTEGVPFVVCTPGRALDLIKRGTLKLDNVKFVALDEADEMLRMGFIEDVDTLLGATPPERQTALFSATIPEPVRRLSEKYMRNPVSIGGGKGEMTVEKVTQKFCLIHETSKLAALTRILEVESIERALIFARTRIGCAQLADALIARGFSAEALHGDLPQEARESVLARFRGGRIALLVATDVAARGLDIPAVSHVINYDFTDQKADYVHRIGRTARAGSEGTAISLVTPREQGRLAEVGFYTKSPPKRMVVPTVAEVHAQRDHSFSLRVEQVVVEQHLDPELQWLDEQAAAGKDLRTLAAALVHMVRVNEFSRPDEGVDEVFSRSRRREGGGYPDPATMRGQGRYDRDDAPRARGRYDRAEPPAPYRKKVDRAEPAAPGKKKFERDATAAPGKKKFERDATALPYKKKFERDESAVPGKKKFEHDESAAPAKKKFERDASALPYKKKFERDETAPAKKKAAADTADAAGGAPYDPRPRRGKTDAPEGGMVTLAIDLGRNAGVKAADVVGALTAEAGIPGSALGAIHIGKLQTTVDVVESFVPKVVKKLRKGFTLRGQVANLERE